MTELKNILHYYFPYKLKCQLMGDSDKNGNLIEYQLQGIELDSEDVIVATFDKDKWYFIEDVFPILQNLSSVNKDQFHNFDFVEIMELKEGLRNIQSMHFSVIELCLKNHIDIFGLIKSGQAIEK